MTFAVVSTAFNGIVRTNSEQALICSSLAVVAQLVEHCLGKTEVSGSIPDNGSIENSHDLIHREFSI